MTDVAILGDMRRGHGFTRGNNHLVEWLASTELWIKLLTEFTRSARTCIEASDNGWIDVFHGCSWKFLELRFVLVTIEGFRFRVEEDFYYTVTRWHNRLHNISTDLFACKINTTLTIGREPELTLWKVLNSGIIRRGCASPQPEETV